ncbi:MAG: PAS domain S-box protein [Cyanobacteria bacterium J06642_11]
MKQGETAFETLFRRQDGSIFPAEVSAKRFQIDNKPVIQGIIRDITERKTA